jgi:hypothetical protein
LRILRSSSTARAAAELCCCQFLSREYGPGPRAVINAVIVKGRGCVRMSKGAKEKRICVAGRCRNVAQSSFGQATDEKWVLPIDTKSWVLTYERVPNLSVSAVHSCFEAFAPLLVYIVSTIKRWLGISEISIMVMSGYLEPELYHHTDAMQSRMHQASEESEQLLN